MQLINYIARFPYPWSNFHTLFNQNSWNAALIEVYLDSEHCRVTIGTFYCWLLLRVIWKPSKAFTGIPRFVMQPARQKTNNKAVPAVRGVCAFTGWVWSRLTEAMGIFFRDKKGYRTFVVKLKIVCQAANIVQNSIKRWKILNKSILCKFKIKG